MSTLTPALFLAHGNPMHALDDNPYTRSWKALAKGIQPDAILVVSAHWSTSPARVCAVEAPETIHDFFGFPPALFNVQYPCPGAPALAADISHRLGIATSNQWGLDHGAWSVLRHLFPDASVPCLQLSLDLSQPGHWHYELGTRLGWLRENRVLVIGSGNIVHNIAKWQADPFGLFDWAADFDRAVARAIHIGDHEPLKDIHSLADSAGDAVPTPEHYLPLLYILGLQRPGETITQTDFPPTSLENVSMRSLRVG